MNIESTHCLVPTFKALHVPHGATYNTNNSILILVIDNLLSNTLFDVTTEDKRKRLFIMNPRRAKNDKAEDQNKGILSSKYCASTIINASPSSL